jgi:uncharacterized membrane protein YdjX (TVP38/TMEM64 family)
MPRSRKHAPVSRKWIAVGLALVAAIAAMAFLPLHDWGDALEAWLEGLGPAGIVLFAAIYIVVTLTLLPAWILSVVAGAVFGIFGGFLLSWSASLVGAAGAFLISRYAARERVKRYFARHAMLQAVDKALRKGGWKVVALLRLSPVIPFTVQNYFFGVTTVKLWHFMAGSAIGIVPGTLIEAWLGATGRAASGGGSPAQWSLLGVGIVATGAATWYVGRVAKKRLGLT